MEIAISVLALIVGVAAGGIALYTLSQESGDFGGDIADIDARLSITDGIVSQNYAHIEAIDAELTTINQAIDNINVPGGSVPQPLPEWESQLETYAGNVGPIEGSAYDSASKPMKVLAAWFPRAETLRVVGTLKMKSDAFDEGVVSFRIPEYGPDNVKTGRYLVPVSGYSYWQQRANSAGMIENSAGGVLTEIFSIRFKADGRLYMHFQSEFQSGSGASGATSKQPDGMKNQTSIGFDLFVPGGFRIV